MPRESVVGQPLDQAVADFARRASDEDNGFAHAGQPSETRMQIEVP